MAAERQRWVVAKGYGGKGGRLWQIHHRAKTIVRRHCDGKLPGGRGGFSAVMRGIGGNFVLVATVARW